MMYIIIVVNCISFILMGIDKRKAKRDSYRISEATLIFSAFCFGSLGSLIGMLVFRHKIRKAKFYIFIPLFLLLHITILIKLVDFG